MSMSLSKVRKTRQGIRVSYGRDRNYLLSEGLNLVVACDSVGKCGVA